LLHLLPFISIHTHTVSDTRSAAFAFNFGNTYQ